MLNNVDNFYIDRYGKFILKPAGTSATPRRSAHAVCINQNALLLSRPADDHVWELPGGGLEPGESTLTALTREIHEETGLTLSNAQAAKLLYAQNIKYYAEKSKGFWDYVMQFYRIEAEWNIQDNPWLAPNGYTVQWIPIQQLHLRPICSSHLPAILKAIIFY